MWEERTGSARSGCCIGVCDPQIQMHRSSTGCHDAHRPFFVLSDLQKKKVPRDATGVDARRVGDNRTVSPGGGAHLPSLTLSTVFRVAPAAAAAAAHLMAGSAGAAALALRHRHGHRAGGGARVGLRWGQTRTRVVGSVAIADHAGSEGIGTQLIVHSDESRTQKQRSRPM